MEVRRAVWANGWYVIEPAVRSWGKPVAGRPLAATVIYRSDQNPWRVTVDEMRALLETAPPP